MARLPPRFHLGAGWPGDAFALGSVLNDTKALAAWLEEDAGRVGAGDAQVGASMLVQHVAMVLGGSTLAAALLHGALPVASVDQIGVIPGGPTRWAFSVDAAEVRTGSPEELMAVWAGEWVDGVLGSLVDAVHGSVRVGRRMLVDNVASAAAANLVFLDWWRPEAGFAGLADLLSKLGTPAIGETVTFSTISHGGRDGLQSSRRSCCLHDRCDPPHWCPTCPQLTDTERTDIMRTHLGHLDAVVAARAAS